MLALIGAVALAVVATARGENVNALWIVIAAVCVYLIAYRFYSLFIAEKVMRLDAARPTPAVRRNDGLDYVPTNQYVLFGHHFAAIAGAGPLVGPVLAAQMGYLPGMLWILAGVVLAGAVQDFMVLFISMRRDGRSLGELIRDGDGADPGRDRAVRHLHDHGHHPRGAGADRGQGAGRQPVGHLHRRGDDPDRAADGRLHALHPAGPRSARSRSSASSLLMLAIVGGAGMSRRSRPGRRCSPSPARSSAGC